MRNRLLIPVLIAVFAASPVLADEIYRWVDSTGQVHYSDVPRDGAEQVELNPAQTFSAPAIPRATSTQTTAEDATGSYTELSIDSPSQEETIWNTGGVITVQVSAEPGLREGHSISIYYDGTELKKGPQSTVVRLSEVFRGEHKITADIKDAAGKVLTRAEPVTFFYRQTANGPAAN
ncbi:MAG: DUF4124 domain-containing protein [Gammaproteobacteria bacterium]|nr:DUF4124 domain-containing protein [Gammaproteobacteria bacterium]